MAAVRQERIFELRGGEPAAGPVIYWMSRDQRAEDNWALLYAQRAALDMRRPLAVVFCLVKGFLNAARRQYDFMLAGLRETAGELEGLGIPFFLLRGEPEDELPRFLAAHRAAMLVADLDPLRIKRKWKDAVADRISIPFREVDAHNIVPCRFVSQKTEYGAYTLRPKIGKLLPEFLHDIPLPGRHPHRWRGGPDRAARAELIGCACESAAVRAPAGFVPGPAAAHDALRFFVKKKLSRYDEDRNDPNRDGQSDLSPYLHFGQIAAQRVALEVSKSRCARATKEAFLEELIVRRELSDNFCLYNPRYDSADGFQPWALRTVQKHRADRREYLYTIEQLDGAATHDPLWNAAQREMAVRGKMHGYMRMYWAKKILEWTPSPEEALSAAICLNDRYELDGRDPNGYAGIAWAIGGTHDRPWGDRKVFGQIRYMSYNGCVSKFDVKQYIAGNP